MSNLSMHETQHLLVAEPAWLTALGARLWVTREGDLNDYVLDPGQRLALARGEQVVIGALERGQAPTWDWTPAAPGRRYGRLRDLAGAGLALAARGLRSGADALAALARSAASMACRAQGCIKA